MQGGDAPPVASPSATPSALDLRFSKQLGEQILAAAESAGEDFPEVAELARFHRVAAEIGSEALVVAAEENPPGKKTPRRKPARALPADWAPNDDHRAIAAEHRVDVSAEAVKFRDYGIATGKTYADHDAAFRNWLRRAQPRQNGVQLARGSQAPRKFRDYLSELAARTSESEKLLETTGEAGESETEK